ncbi:MAG: ATP-binding protein [Thermodesulfobacteriota bacterium]|nr:ATP-binding protein [Thermodesulfobacteriota bacterium]
MKNNGHKEGFRVKISIFHKLILHIALTVFVTVGITTYLAVKVESRALTQSLINTGEYTTRNLALNTERAFTSLNWIFVEKMLQEADKFKKDGVVFAKLVKPDGEVCLASDRAYYGDIIDPSLLSDHETIVDNYPLSAEQEKGLLLVHPLSIGQETWYVLVGLSLNQIKEATTDLVVRNVVWGGLIILLAMTVSFFLSKSISNPLISLAKSAETLSQGDLDQKVRVQVQSRDEVGLLGDSFNKMIENLKAAKLELQASEQRNRTLIDTASKAKIGIAVVQNEGEQKGILKFFNQYVIELAGYTEEELAGKFITEIIHPDDLERIWNLYIERPSANELRTTYEFWGLKKNGDKIPIEISTGITEFDGKNAVVCYVRDITAKLDAEEKLKKYSQKLEKMVQERTSELESSISDLENTQSQLLQSEKMASIGQLAAGVAHEINNPVGFVKSNLGTLNEYREDLTELLALYESFEEKRSKADDVLEDTAGQEALGEIQKTKEKIDLDFILDDFDKVIDESIEGMARVSKIVADLKNFAHAGDDKLEYTDINQGLQSTLNIVWNELKYKADVSTDFGDIPQVNCYPQRLNQVFMNLLVNAAQSIEDRGEIKILTRAKDDQVIISISDTGSGIPPEVMSKIFDPFFTTKEVGKGTGLGLNVAYNIIQGHKGTIEVDSVVGKGTTFTITLQIEPDFASDEAKQEGNHA